MAQSLPARSKAALRAAALSARDGLSREVRAAAAQAVARHTLPFAVTRSTVVAGYSAIRSEIDPLPLMQTLAAQGARLALPAVAAAGRELIFRAWCLGDRLRPGPLGIKEPSPDAGEVLPDIMLVPLAAFDRFGQRIGYGAGHYDLTFAHLRKIKPVIGVGLAFAVQEIEAIPALAHDVALDYVLTETKTFEFRSS